MIGDKPMFYYLEYLVCNALKKKTYFLPQVKNSITRIFVINYGIKGFKCFLP